MGVEGEEASDQQCDAEDDKQHPASQYCSPQKKVLITYATVFFLNERNFLLFYYVKSDLFPNVIQQ